MKYFCLIVLVLLLLSCSEPLTRNNPYDTHFDLPEPENVQIEHVSLTSKKISWEYDIDNIEGFKVSRKQNEIWLEEAIVAADQRIYTEENVPVNENIQYKVIAFAGSNHSDDVVSVIIDNTIPVPENFIVVQENIHCYGLTWEQDHIIGEDGFIIERKIEDGDYIQIAVLDENTESYQDEWEDDSREVNYIYYRIKAYLGEEYSSWINTINLIVPPPENLTLSIENENITLTWSYELEGIEGFRIEKKEVGGEWDLYVENIALELREWYDDNCNNWDSYRIKAYYQEYESGYSNAVMFEEGMIYVEGGTFEMGDHFNEGDSDELPIHNVTLSSFYIGQYEVTQGEYEEVMGTNPAHNYGVSDEYPVYYVTWYDAVEYCNALSEQEGLTPCYNLSDWSCNFSADGYRLPTEAEWEYATRGGVNWEDNYKYSGTTNELGDYAWFNSNSGSQTHEVGTRESNQLGIYDMSGNVWEWCNDWYSSSFYSSSPEDNPVGHGSGSDRAQRGGSWGSNARDCRTASRGHSSPTGSFNLLGFRLVRANLY
ncbi:MAG: formylglycine-generating enzyme family protein [Candidatus Cloacimonetes bacterium]|nr:formylglycine-generating enzyme family protein [Candidatus Cloacimonadota bacterium]